MYRGAPVFLDANNRVALSDRERNLFETLTQHLAGTELRVAGGWVRDKLLGLSSDDIDISLNNLTGLEAAQKLKTSVKGASSIGQMRANPEASKHLETACIRIQNYQLDFANLRTESYTSTRIPEMVTSRSVIWKSSRRRSPTRPDNKLSVLQHRQKHHRRLDWIRAARPGPKGRKDSLRPPGHLKRRPFAYIKNNKVCIEVRTEHRKRLITCDERPKHSPMDKRKSQPRAGKNRIRKDDERRKPQPVNRAP